MRGQAREVLADGCAEHGGIHAKVIRQGTGGDHDVTGAIAVVIRTAASRPKGLYSGIQTTDCVKQALHTVVKVFPRHGMA